MTQPGDENRGLLLKKAREQLGLSINDVAVATKINPRILKALEDNQRESLPAKSFTRGFIRTYAAYLKIDAKPILEAYDSAGDTRIRKTDETPAPSTGAEVKAASGKKQNSTLTGSSPSSKIFLVASILFLVVLIIGIKKVVDKYAHERAVENVSGVLPGASPSPAASADVTATASPNPQASASPGADEDADADTDADESATPSATANGSPQPAPSATPSKAPTTAAIATVKPPEPPPKETNPPKATDKLADKPVEPKVEAKAAVAPTIKPKPTPVAAPTTQTDAENGNVKTGKPQEVIIEALDNVEVTIQIDDEPSTTVKLTPESIHTIKAKSQIDLEIADGGMVNLIYNGHERGVPGVLGKPVKIKFP